MPHSNSIELVLELKRAIEKSLFFHSYLTLRGIEFEGQLGYDIAVCLGGLIFLLK